MSEEASKSCAYLNAACTRATLIAMGMQARNMQCILRQQPPMYMEEDFMRVFDSEGIGFNDVQSVLYHK
mgnify:FL=1